MSVVPGNLHTGQQPPMTIPLRHFLVGLGFLILGSLVGLGSEIGVFAGYASLGHVHLVLVGWICVTIMGAMTQFVPVWSGVSLHSRRLSAIQLWFVAVGLLGFVLGLLTGWFELLLPFGALMLLGFWVFAYNVGRTLWTIDDYDVTERHFAIALGFFVLLTPLGFLLAVDFIRPLFDGLPVVRSDVVASHATLAVFGAILTTVFGALYQLATMFTQTELHGIDVPLSRFVGVGYPVGVLALATARLSGIKLLGTFGGLLIVGGVLGHSIILGRRLYETRVDWTPMLSRYAVLAPAMAAWAVLTAPAWIHAPLAKGTRFGAPGTVHLLTIGVIGFVVLGTLYHIVPFIVWVHRYGDLLGYEPVPMIEDLYSDRIARADFAAFVGGGGLLVGTDLFAVPASIPLFGGTLFLAGAIFFLWNMLEVVRAHSPHTLAATFGLSRDPERSSDEPAGEPGGP